jgi:hypothetical protein
MNAELPISPSTPPGDEQPDDPLDVPETPEAETEPSFTVQTSRTRKTYVLHFIN